MICGGAELNGCLHASCMQTSPAGSEGKSKYSVSTAQKKASFIIKKPLLDLVTRCSISSGSEKHGCSMLAGLTAYVFVAMYFTAHIYLARECLNEHKTGCSKVCSKLC